MKLSALLPALALLLLPSLRANEAAAPKAADTYPLSTCAVSGEGLDSMDGPYIHIHKEAGKPDREVRLCCKGCLKKFSKDPAKYIGKLDEAAKAKSAKPETAADAHAGHNH